MSAPEQGGLSGRGREVWRITDRERADVFSAGFHTFGCPDGTHQEVGARQDTLTAAVEAILAARLAAAPAGDAELRAAVEGLADLSAAATPGPWEVERTLGWDAIEGHGGAYVAELGTKNDPNAEFIVAAVNLVRSLLAGRGDV